MTRFIGILVVAGGLGLTALVFIHVIPQANQTMAGFFAGMFWTGIGILISMKEQK